MGIQLASSLHGDLGPFSVFNTLSRDKSTSVQGFFLSRLLTTDDFEGLHPFTPKIWTCPQHPPWGTVGNVGS